MRCSNCRKELMLGSAYCDRCGYSVLGSPPPPEMGARPNPVFTPRPAASKRPAMPGKRRRANLPVGCGVTIALVVLGVAGAIVFGVVAGVRAVVDEVASDPDPVEFGFLSPNASVRGSVDEDQVARFQINGGGRTVLVSAVAIEGFDPVVAVFDADGDEIGSDDDGGGGRDALLVLDLELGATYVVEVEGFSGRSGEFTLGVFDQVRTDDLTVTGSPLDGALVARQRALYALEPVAGREVTVDVHGVGTFDPTLRIRDADGQQLGYEDDTNGRDPQLTLTVPSGAVAEVAEYSNRGGEYTITVSCGGAAC